VRPAALRLRRRPKALGTMTPELPVQLRGLLRPEAYPHPVATIELIQTHVSWVLLTGDFAYKIKRPVRYPFVDLSSAERREFSCREELRLNRRFAPELYLDVCEITAECGVARINGGGQAIEHSVKMLQFERAAELNRLLERNSITPLELATFGRQLVAIHARLPKSALADAWGHPEHVQALILRNLDECAQAANAFHAGADVEALREPLAARLCSLANFMATRRADGWIRECHGDLHSGNIVRRGARLVAFDCMEFEPAFRWIDVADEVSFLLSDLGARGYALHAHAFLGGYLAQAGDYQICRLLRTYQAHRALVRAKIVALNADDARDSELRLLHATFACRVRYAASVLNPIGPRLLLTFGLSGAGKTWLARQLSERLGAIHLRSDLARKRLAGLAEAARTGSRLGQDLYSERANTQVYRKLRRDAEDVLAGGYDVIVDATFGRRTDRAEFRHLAERCGVEMSLIICRAPIETLRARINARAGSADASEADERVLAWQIQHQEAPDAAEEACAINADTTDPVVVEWVLKALGPNRVET
jgi:aminoglycoside phosphotransferase family enzyme/predicted kinase